MEFGDRLMIQKNLSKGKELLSPRKIESCTTSILHGSSVHMNVDLTKTYDIFIAVSIVGCREEMLERRNSLRAINPHVPNKEITREYLKNITYNAVL